MTSVTNDPGMVKDVFQYTPYGQVTLGSKEHGSFYAYSGENFNPNTGLEYLRSRYYNTAMGRFQTEDMYLGNLNVPLTLNRYSCVMNNPINYIDPSGHMAAKQFTNTVLGSNVAAVVNPNLKKSAKKVDVGNSNSLTSRTVRTLKSSAAPSVPVSGNTNPSTVSNARQAVNKVRARKDCGTAENGGFTGWARDRANDIGNFMNDAIYTVNNFCAGVAAPVVYSPIRMLAQFTDWFNSMRGIRTNVTEIFDQSYFGEFLPWTGVDPGSFAFKTGQVGATTASATYAGYNFLNFLSNLRIGTIPGISSLNISGGAATMEMVTAEGLVITVRGAGEVVISGAGAASQVAILAAGNGGNYPSGGQRGTGGNPNFNKVNIPKNVKRQVNKLSPEAKKGYDKAIDALKGGDTRGLNDHPLSGNRSGQRAIDIKGTGRGRGAGRIIYEYGENGEINIIEILTDHNY